MSYVPAASATQTGTAPTAPSKSRMSAENKHQSSRHVAEFRQNSGISRKSGEPVPALRDSATDFDGAVTAPIYAVSWGPSLTSLNLVRKLCRTVALPARNRSSLTTKFTTKFLWRSNPAEPGGTTPNERV